MSPTDDADFSKHNYYVSVYMCTCHVFVKHCLVCIFSLVLLMWHKNGVLNGKAPGSFVGTLVQEVLIRGVSSLCITSLQWNVL